MVRTKEIARRKTGGCRERYWQHVSSKKESNVKTDKPALTTEPSELDDEEVEKPTRQTKRLRLADTDHPNRSSNQSSMTTMTNSSNPTGPVEKSPISDNEQSKSTVSTSNAETTQLTKDNDTLMGLLNAKNAEIQILTNILKENKAKWAAAEERLKMENLEAKKLLAENSATISRLTESMNIITQVCEEVKTNAKKAI